MATYTNNIDANRAFHEYVTAHGITHVRITVRNRSREMAVADLERIPGTDIPEYIITVLDDITVDGGTMTGGNERVEAITPANPDEQEVTLYRSEGNEYQEPTYGLNAPHPALDSRPFTVHQATLQGLMIEESPEHGGAVLVDQNGTIWSVANALALGRLVVR